MSTVPNSQIFDEASEWFVSLREEPATALMQERFMSWLRKSPEHVRAYLGVVALWADVPATDRHEDNSTEALIARARAEENVVAIEDVQSLAGHDRAQPRRTRSARFKVAALAASVAVLSTAGVLAWMQFARASLYTTDVGEQRAFALPDGSRIELNSDSRVRVRFDDVQRVVQLLQGQALFKVAADPRRPFHVESERTRIQVIGTEFDVYRRKEGSIVTVLEGRVAVSSVTRSALGATSPSPVLLSAGEQLTGAPGPSSTPVRVENLPAITAWTRGQLMFKSAPLSEVVEEFNRYNTRALRLSGPVEDFEITAVFSSTDPKMLLEFLKQQPDLNVAISGSDIRILPAPAK